MSDCFVKLADVKKILCDSCQEECEKTTCDYQAILSELREKAVDAEPVVRCKDCWRREKLTDNKGNVAYVCKSPWGLKGMVHDNDFCCDGERGKDGL